MSQQNPSVEEANAYAAEYIKTQCQTTAFKAAFPNSKSKPDIAHQKASKLHKTDRVQTRIAELTQASKERTEKKFAISADDIKEHLLEIIALGKQKKVDQQGNEIAHNLAAASSALAELNKMDGNHAATKHKHEVTSVPKVIVKDLTGGGSDE